MVEMAATGDADLYRRGYAGDSYNTAIYLARAGLPVSYLTRLGQDVFSQQILAQLDREGIDTRYIECAGGEQVGLYTIHNDADGERTFSYWRQASAARALFRTLPSLTGIDVFYFTGITLAVTRGDHANLVALLAQLRESGTRIAFDPNYRPALWDSPAQARSLLEAVLPYCNIVLPTLDDERALRGVGNTADCLDMFAQYGIEELVLKGDDGLAQVLCNGQVTSAQATMVTARDTTGAGDAFNAGYLAARLQGAAINDALGAAQALAAAVVQHHGAILPRQQRAH